MGESWFAYKISFLSIIPTFNNANAEQKTLDSFTHRNQEWVRLREIQHTTQQQKESPFSIIANQFFHSFKPSKQPIYFRESVEWLCAHYLWKERRSATKHASTSTQQQL